MKTATSLLRRLLAVCAHGRSEHTFCASCLRDISDEARS